MLLLDIKNKDTLQITCSQGNFFFVNTQFVLKNI